MRPPRVAVFTMGGTIGSEGSPAAGYRPVRPGEDLVLELLESTPAGADTPSVHVRELSRTPSYMLTTEDLERLVHEVRLAARDPTVDGIVILQGTAAMEEVAYLLDVAVGADTPIVLTGAMRALGLPGYDGGRNLLDALRVASQPPHPPMGVTVVFGGDVHAARDVRKLHRSSLNPFHSNGGPLARVDGDRVQPRRPARRRVHVDTARLAGPVDVVGAFVGADGYLVRAARERQVRGLVIDGLPGGGGVSAEMFSEIEAALADSIPVALTSRAPHGRGKPDMAGGAGPRDLVEAGVLLAGDLSAGKARMLLMCAAAANVGGPDLRRLFAAVS